MMHEKTMEVPMARVMIENIPDDVRNRFKARCALYENTMREELIQFMDARGGSVDGLKQTINRLLTQLIDEMVSKTESAELVDIQQAFESFAFPEVNDEDEFQEYRSMRLLEIEEERDNAATMQDEDLIEREWEQIEAWREEQRELYEEEQEELEAEQEEEE